MSGSQKSSEKDVATPESSGSLMIVAEKPRYKDHIDDGVFKGLFLPKRERFDAGEPPDGGWVAWRQSMAMFLSNMCSWGVVNMFGVYEQQLRAPGGELANESSSRVAWIGSLAACLVMFSNFFFGFLCDLGYQREMSFVGAFMMCLCGEMLSLCKTYSEFMVVQGLLTGLTSSCVFLASMTLVAPMFSKNRPIAICLGTTGSAVGGVVFSVLARTFMTALDFRWAARIIGFICLVLSLCAFTLTRRRLPPSTRTNILGWEAFTEPAFMAYCIGIMATMASLYSFMFQYQAYCVSLIPDDPAEQLRQKQEHKHLNYEVFYYMTAIVNAGAVVGRSVPGILAEIYGPINVSLGSTVLSLIVAWTWFAAHSSYQWGGLVAIGLLFGCVSAPAISMPSIVTSKLTKDPTRLGIRMSVTQLFAGGGVILGAPFSGMLAEKQGWIFVKLYAGCLYIFAVVTMVICRQIHSKNKFWANV